MGAGRGAGLLGLGFLGRNVPLGGGLVLLGLAFPLTVFIAGHPAEDLLGLALHVLDDALCSGAGAGLFIAHGETPLLTLCLWFCVCRTGLIPVAPTEQSRRPVASECPARSRVPFGETARTGIARSSQS